QYGAVTVTESQVPGFRAYDINDEVHLAFGMRSEGAFNLVFIGYSWDTSKGENPDLTLLGSSANWIKYATSNKMTAGTLLDLSGTATTG
ncbi:major capsid protein, partial [Acinetobacter baumannii]|uniref:major capsid protein n=1 Tax=Acinetobacter baumannii TaxID=470 RepID=UPI0012726038